MPGSPIELRDLCWKTVDQLGPKQDFLRLLGKTTTNMCEDGEDRGCQGKEDTETSAGEEARHDWLLRNRDTQQGTSGKVRGERIQSGFLLGFLAAENSYLLKVV